MKEAAPFTTQVKSVTQAPAYQGAPFVICQSSMPESQEHKAPFPTHLTPWVMMKMESSESEASIHEDSGTLKSSQK